MKELRFKTGYVLSHRQHLNQLFLLAVIIAAAWGRHPVLNASCVLSSLILPMSTEEDKDYDLFGDETRAQRAQQAGEDEEEGGEPPPPPAVLISLTPLLAEATQRIWAE